MGRKAERGRCLLYEEVAIDLKKAGIGELSAKIFSNAQIRNAVIARILDDKGTPLIELFREDKNYFARGSLPPELNKRFLDKGLNQRHDGDKLDSENCHGFPTEELKYIFQCEITSDQLQTLNQVTREFYRDQKPKSEAPPQQDSGLSLRHGT